MHRLTAPLPGPRHAAFATALFLALPAGLAAQDDRAEQAVQQALLDLLDPASARDATRRLQNLGALAVPPLAAALAPDAPRPLSVHQRMSVAYVLGRVGKPALPALPALRHALRADVPAVGRHAAWALAVLVPFMDRAQADAVAADLAAAPRELQHDWFAELLLGALRVGPDPGPGNLRALLGIGPANTIAVSRWITARADELGDVRPDLIVVLQSHMDPLLVRPAMRLAKPQTFEGADLADALLVLSKEALSARTARALLDHWHEEQRRRAIAWLDQHGATLPVRERADLVARLWDSENELAIAAAQAFARWGQAGFVALPALRLMERNHHEPTVAAACRGAADAVVAAADTLSANDRAWLTAVDNALRGETPATPPKGASRAVLELLSEVLYLAQWSGAAPLARVLSLCETAGPIQADAIRAVLGWLHHDDAGVVEQACAWLARRGLATRSAFSAVADDDTGTFDEFLRHASQYVIVDGALRSSIEMLAHLLVAGRKDHERARLLEDGNSRVVAHAIATALAERKGALRATTTRLGALIHPPEAATMRVSASAWDQRTLYIDLSNHVRTLAAVALVDLGVVFAPAGDYEPPPDLDDVVRQTIGIPLAELPQHVSSLRESNRLPALVDRIEDQCRLLMSVPPHLRWPSLAGTTR